MIQLQEMVNKPEEKKDKKNKIWLCNDIKRVFRKQGRHNNISFVLN